jgi:hypothetical protein
LDSGNPAGTCPAPYTTIGSVCLQYLVEAGELNFADSVKFCMLNGGSGIQTFDKAGGYVDTSNGELDNILVMCLQCLSMPRVHDLYWLKMKFSLSLFFLPLSLSLSVSLSLSLCLSLSLSPLSLVY